MIAGSYVHFDRFPRRGKRPVRRPEGRIEGQLRTGDQIAGRVNAGGRSRNQEECDQAKARTERSEPDGKGDPDRFPEWMGTPIHSRLNRYPGRLAGR